MKKHFVSFGLFLGLIDEKCMTDILWSNSFILQVKLNAECVEEM